MYVDIYAARTSLVITIKIYLHLINCGYNPFIHNQEILAQKQETRKNKKQRIILKLVTIFDLYGGKLRSLNLAIIWSPEKNFEVLIWNGTRNIGSLNKNLVETSNHLYVNIRIWSKLGTNILGEKELITK